MENQSLRSKLENCLKQMDLRAEVLRQVDNKKVTFSALFNSEGAEVSAGSGNGDSSEQKSWAECIEHFFFLHSESSIGQRNVKELREQPGFEADGILKGLPVDQVLPTILFESLQSPGLQIHVPLDYVSRQRLPNSEFLLKKHCSSSGYSFHQSRNEALLHGLLEVTERHEFSKVLLGRQHAYQINRESLPPPVQADLSDLESRFHGEILLFAIEPEFSAWTTFVIFYPETEDFPIPQTSQKTRMDLVSSLQGALSEMRQILYLYSEEERKEDLAVFSIPHLRSHPCIGLDGLRDAPKADVSELFWSFEKEKSAKENLGILVQSLIDKGFHPFSRVVFEFENGCHVTQVFVPGFEKYNLIRLGVEVPSHQGRQV